VPADGHEIHAPRLNVDGDFAGGLCGVRVEEQIAVAGLFTHTLQHATYTMQIGGAGKRAHTHKIEK